MKVLHIGKYFAPRYGGIESFMSQLMQQQVLDAHDVSALVHADELQSREGSYIWLNCKVYEVKTYGQFAFAPIAPLYALKLMQVLKRTEPDIIHVHMPNLSAFWLLIIKRFVSAEAKIVTHWHSDVLGASPTKLVRFLYPMYSILEKWLLSLSDVIIATSPDYLASSVPLKFVQRKTKVVPLGISLKDVELHPNKSIQLVDFSLIMLGRLSYYKGHSLVLEALANLKRKGLDFHLNVVGSGDKLNDLFFQTKNLQLNENVTWHGSVPEAQKEQLLKASQLILLPSIERTEAFGVVLLEAAKECVPALVSDVEGSGMQYVVVDGETGIVVENNSVKDLQDKLEFAMTNKSELSVLGRNARSRLENKFDIKVVSNEITKIYEGSTRQVSH